MSVTLTATKTCSSSDPPIEDMKILFAYPFCGLGGVETATINRADALAAQGHEAVVSFRTLYGDGGHVLASMPGVVVQDDEAVIKMVRDGSFDAFVAIDFPEIVRKLGSTGTRTPVVFETHSGYLPAARRFYAGVDHPVVRGIIVPAQLNGRRVLAATRTTKPVFVVPNATDLDQFHLCPGGAVRGEWKHLVDRTIVLWIGRLEDLKNPREAVEIAAAFAADHPELTFLMVGDSPGDPGYREMIRSAVPKSVESQFEFREYVPFDRMPLLYSLAGLSGGCLLSTSRAEACPMTFLEAMACECPIVSSRVDGIDALVPHGSRGWLYEPGDIAGGTLALRTAMDEATADQRRAVIEQSLAYVKAEHAPVQIASEYTRSVQELINTRPRDASGAAVLAVISTLNDGDVISAVIEHLVEDGIDVHLIDHGSADDTSVEASRWLGRGLTGLESFPIVPGSREVGEPEPAMLGRRQEEVCREAGASWCLHQRGHDVAYGPWPGLSLLKAIEHVDRLGFNCIETRALTFRPVDDSFRKGSDPRVHFSFWEDGDDSEIIAWKRGTPVADRRVFPIRFVTCRYPIRSGEQGSWQRSELQHFDLDRVRLENQLQNERMRASEEKYEELVGFVHRLGRGIESESELISRALKLVSRRRRSGSQR
jgi:L-malate glycosyltransferase